MAVGSSIVSTASGITMIWVKGNKNNRIAYAKLKVVQLDIHCALYP